MLAVEVLIAYVGVMDNRPNANHNPHDRRHAPHHQEWHALPDLEVMRADMLAVAVAMLGPQFDESSNPRWGVVEDSISYSGQAITDGGANYFVYGKSTILPHGAKEDKWGLKRVWFDEKTGLKKTISTRAYRRPSEEFPPDRPGYISPA